MARTLARRRSSLRTRLYAVMIVVVVTPLVVTWLALFTDRDSTSTMQRAVEQAASDVAAGGSIEEAARVGRARVVVIGEGGEILAHADHEATTTLRDKLGDRFVGPEGGPHLDDWEGMQPQLAGRAEVIDARRNGATSRCERALEGRLAVCVAARSSARGVVLVERSTQRAIRALYDLRYPLLKLTLGVLCGALLLTAWLARALLRPIEVLREQVMTRAATGGPATPIVVRTRSEFADLAQAFNDLLLALESRARQNEAFVADLVHELKNPVAAVRASAEALTTGGPVDEARAARLGAALTTSGRRLDALVTRFLELARAEAGLVGEPRERVDLAALARGLVATLETDARFVGTRFQVTAQAACEVVGVASRIESALANVVENAASFAGPEGIVEVRVERSGEHVEMSVVDSGAGHPRGEPRARLRALLHHALGGPRDGARARDVPRGGHRPRRHAAGDATFGKRRGLRVPAARRRLAFHTVFTRGPSTFHLASATSFTSTPQGVAHGRCADRRATTHRSARAGARHAHRLARGRRRAGSPHARAPRRGRAGGAWRVGRGRHDLGRGTPLPRGARHAGDGAVVPLRDAVRRRPEHRPPP